MGVGEALQQPWVVAGVDARLALSGAVGRRPTAAWTTCSKETAPFLRAVSYSCTRGDRPAGGDDPAARASADGAGAVWPLGAGEASVVVMKAFFRAAKPLLRRG
jgi:hypothetical protein